MHTYTKNWFKFTVGFIICLLVRLIPFRAPNIEPILATQMPFSKAFGGFAGFIFGFLSIVLYDIATGTIGMWSLFTAGAYGVLGFWAAFYFKKHQTSAWSYVRFAIMGTLFFDIVTGLSVGPLFFHQSFMSAVTGQIPFTLWHLVGNISFALILSPAIYHFVVENKKFETPHIVSIFNSKKI